MTPHEKIALIYHYDLAAALNGEQVEWLAVPVDLDAGREGAQIALQAKQWVSRVRPFTAPIKTAATTPKPTTDDTDVKARVAELVEAGHADKLKAAWPFRADGTPVPTFKAGGHIDGDLDLITAAVEKVRRDVEAPFDVVVPPNPQPRVETNPQPVVETVDEGAMLPDEQVKRLRAAFQTLPKRQAETIAEIARDANAIGRSISVSTSPTERRGAIAEALIGWATSGSSYDELWTAVALSATSDQTADAEQRLGHLLSRFTIDQARSLASTFGTSAAA